jgi:hypothetical protein
MREDGGHYATPAGDDIIARELRHCIRSCGRIYYCVSSTYSAVKPHFYGGQLFALQETIAADETSVRVYGEDEGPFIGSQRPFSLTTVIVLDGDIAAIVDTVGGGPVPPGLLLAKSPVPNHEAFVNAALTAVDMLLRLKGASA